MVGIILQLNRNRCDLLVPEQLHAEYDSPLCRTEVLSQAHVQHPALSADCRLPVCSKRPVKRASVPVSPLKNW